MTLQKGTKNGWPIVEDSGAVGTPVTNLTGDGGDLLAELLANVATKVPRRLHINVTPVGNVGGGEDDLMSYTIPANTLVNNGDMLKFDIGLNANNYTPFCMYFAGSQFSDGNLGDSNFQAQMTATITRLTSSTAMCSCRGGSDALEERAAILTGLDFTTTNIFKTTATGSSNDDLQQVSLFGTYHPAA